MMERIAEKRKAAGEGGFTLIELLVVIIILGILAAVVVFAVGGVGDKGQSAACKIDTRTLRTGLEANYAQTGSYTATATDGQDVTTGPSVNEAALVTGGFLSEQSTLHNAKVVDTDATVGTVVQGIVITIQDTKCGGTAGQAVDSTATPPRF